METNFKTKEDALKQLSIVDSEMIKLLKIVEDFDKPKDIMQMISESSNKFGCVIGIAKEKGYISTWVEKQDFETLGDYAFRQLKLISKVLNDGYVGKANVKRYFPRFSVSSGFVFSHTSCVKVDDYATSGFYLALENPQKVEFSANNFLHIWKNYITE